LIEIKAPGLPFADSCTPIQMKECIMDTGGILFLVLIFAAAGVFAATLAYYSRG
jgi:hypothetical protein